MSTVNPLDQDLETTQPQPGDIIVQGQQWLRYAVLNFNSKDRKFSFDLSALRFRFQITSTQIETPNSMTLRIYNPTEDTVNKLIGEYEGVALEAGYINAQHGVIFGGTVRQWRRGRENATDTFLEVIAATADQAYNFGYVSKTLGAGTSWMDIYGAVCEAFGVARDQPSMETMVNAAKQAFYPRGRVLDNLGRAVMRDLAGSIGAHWSIQTIAGTPTLVLIPYVGIRPGQAVILNADTGLIGVPEATPDGVIIRLLLNPTLTIGTGIILKSSLINRSETNPDTMLQAGMEIQPDAPTAPNGLYRVLTIDHVGDTRGQEWYTEIICLALDQDVVIPAGSGRLIDETGRVPVGQRR